MLRYSDELQFASARELFYFRPALSGPAPEADPDNIRLRIKSSGCALLLDSAAAIWNESLARIELALDLSANGLALKCGSYAVEVEFDCASAHYACECAFDIVPHPWRPNLALDDVLALLPSVAYEGGDGAALSALAAEAEEQLRLRIRAAGMTPGLIANRAALDMCLRALLISLACQRASRNAGRDGLWNKHLSWQATFESKWRELSASIRYDADSDGVANSTDCERAAVRLRP